MLKEIKNLFAFLTILPLRMDKDCLADCARFMFLFPLVGAFLGLLAGAFGWVASLFLPVLVVGALALGLLLLLTGLHHTDGLLDFGDAVMYHGTAERKIEIMHDQLTGAGALALAVMTYLVSALALAELGSFPFAGLGNGMMIAGLVVVELSAKMSMVVGAWAGNAVHQGMSSTFLEAMHGRNGNIRLAAALGICFAVAVPLLWFEGFMTVMVAMLTALIMVAISQRHFKGVTGDVLGATNELTRMTCLIVLLAMVR
jgi:adenosylcobinamide-GDP ribazoletransferase